MCLEMTLHFLCLSFTLPLPLFISLAWRLCLLFHPETTRNQKKNSPACTPACIHFPASESISCALHPVTMNWSCSYPRPALSLLHQILSVCLTPVCLTIPPTMLPAFFRWSIFPFLLDHSHQHQTCCNFSHLKQNKTSNHHFHSYPPSVFCAIIEKLLQRTVCSHAQIPLLPSSEFSSDRFTTHQ